jgi:hypothetical protein
VGDLEFADKEYEADVQGGEAGKLEEGNGGAAFNDGSQSNSGQETLQSTGGASENDAGGNTDVGDLEFADKEAEADVQGGDAGKLEEGNGGAAFNDGSQSKSGQGTLQSTDGADENEADDQKEGVTGELRWR